jgi:hypothetical protein
MLIKGLCIERAVSTLGTCSYAPRCHVEMLNHQGSLSPKIGSSSASAVWETTLWTIVVAVNGRGEGSCYKPSAVGAWPKIWCFDSSACSRNDFTYAISRTEGAGHWLELRCMRGPRRRLGHSNPHRIWPGHTVRAAGWPHGQFM